MPVIPSPKFLAIFVLAVALTGCANRIPREALRLSPESVQTRQMQSRYFDTANETAILSASAAVLQDLGFNLEESETGLGVIVVSKRRDAREVGQMVGAMMRSIFTFKKQSYDEEQEIRASLVTRPSASGERVSVRITLQRTVWDTEGEVTKIEGIHEPRIYQHFFDKLSKSVFLDAHLT